MKTLYPVLSLLLIATLSCKREPAGQAPERVDTQVYTRIQEQLLDAKPGDVIEIPEGTYYFDRPLSLDAIPNVTIKGAGMEKTILSFQGQKAGAEGLRITADSVTIMDLTVMDTKGDAIKIQDSKWVTLKNLKTTWSGGARSTNGGYGLYPVACTNVLIENCEASFASDAGIYVGQSRNVVVRNCYAHENVAGIEIENCTNAEVYSCRAENNTGGILVFDLPDLPAGNGHGCRVHHNNVIGNNHKNFAPEGGMVAIVAPGTGVILLAAKGVEVFDNEIMDHKTMGAAIASYHTTGLEWKDDKYDPFAYDIYFHGNSYQRKKALPDLTKDFGKMVNVVFKGKPQDILYDGIVDDKRPKGPNPMNICIEEKGNDLRFANADAANDFKSVDTNMKRYQCKMEAIPKVQMQ